MEKIDNEYYVSPEVAKLLEKAGFDWRCKKCYNKGVLFDMESDEIREQCPQHSSYDVLAPTLAVAQRWLREIRHRSIEVKSFVDGTVENRGKWWIWHVYNFNPPIDWVLLMGSDRRYSTYEEALEAGIKKALEIILKK